ncbi:MAG: drug:proton antiporter, partial [Dehalococcoidia bacterium]|nr:drug:proton antiporter [Dehalococcoidia bacterium]
VSLSTGEFAKLGIESLESHLGDATAAEKKYDRIKGLAEGRRLSCQAEMRGDVVIDVPAESQIHRQMVRKAADEIRDLEIDPVVKLFYVELDRPRMADQTCDLTRVLETLEREWELTGLSA